MVKQVMEVSKSGLLATTNFPSQCLGELGSFLLLLYLVTTAAIYLYKVINGKARAMPEMCSNFNNKDTRTTSMTVFWCLYC